MRPCVFFFFSSRRRHTILTCDWSSDVCFFRSDEQVDSNARVLMHVSNFRPVKRVRDVVRIFGRVVKKIPSVLVMVGDGPDRVEAEAEAREIGRASCRERVESAVGAEAVTKEQV